jgi:MFS family permease
MSQNNTKLYELNHNFSSTGIDEKADINQKSSIITFSENDNENPLNWSSARKWSITLVVSLSVFLMPLSSSIVAPELSTISNELQMGSSLEAVLVLSTFVLTYCLGPLLLGPLSEIFGRVAVLHFGNSFYLLFNLVCGFARNKAQLLAFRLLAGFGGAGGLVVSLFPLW